MITETLTPNFHDAVIVSCAMEKHDRLEMVVWNYDLHDATTEYLAVTFSGIFNATEVGELINKVSNNPATPDRNGTRIDNLSYDPQNVSKTRSLYLLLELDGYEQIVIHCKKLRIVVLNGAPPDPPNTQLPSAIPSNTIQPLDHAKKTLFAVHPTHEPADQQDCTNRH